MPILNYTTSIQVDKTVIEIQRVLVRMHASAIMTEFDSDGVLSSLSFRVNHPQYGNMSYCLPANIEHVWRALCKDAKVPKSKKTREQAARVAWRIVKDWVEAQMAMVEAQLAEVEQVFLPYMQGQSGDTVYELFKGGALALSPPKQ